MTKSIKPWLNVAIVSVMVITLLAGCGTANNQNDNVAPSPTRTDGMTGPGVNNAGPNNGWNDGGNGRNNIGPNDGWNNGIPGTTANNNMRLADNIADKLADRRDIENATVLLSDDNAFVAVDIPGNQQGGLTNDLKKSISRDVKKMDKSVDNVFVSADADFFDRMRSYARDIRDGQPIGGMVDQVTETLRRIFPTAY